MAVCACTYARPLGLARLLAALAALEQPGGVAVRLVVVDNEAHAPRRALAEGFARDVPWPVTYLVEPRRGIAQARNAAVRAALADAAVDAVAFLDDDEVPDPGWLVELVAAWRRSGADIVTGPVVPLLDRAAPRWVARGRFFERPRYRDGAELHFAWTSNVLITRTALGIAAPPFNERLGLAGGEDTYFFRMAHLAGLRIVWADSAVVAEHVQLSRCTPSWLLRREYRRGNTLSVCLVSLEGSLPRRAKRVVHAASALLRGLATLLLAPVLGWRAVVAGGQSLCFAAGLVSGLTGHVYLEYEQAHGD